MPFLATLGSMPVIAGQHGYVSHEEQADEQETTQRRGGVGPGSLAWGFVPAHPAPGRCMSHDVTMLSNTQILSGGETLWTSTCVEVPRGKGSLTLTWARFPSIGA